MSSKSTRRLAAQMSPRDPKLQLRQGTVDTVNGDGTLDVTLGADTTVIESVQMVDGGAATAGQTVWVLQQGPLLLALGGNA